MAAPVPVLSRMTVLVCLPPKVIGRVSPAEAAISMKRMTGAVSASKNAVRIAIPAAPRRSIIAPLRIVAKHLPAVRAPVRDQDAIPELFCIPARSPPTDAFSPAAGRAARAPPLRYHPPAARRGFVPPLYRSDWRERARARNHRDKTRNPASDGALSRNQTSPPLSRSFRNEPGPRGPTRLRPMGRFEAHPSGPPPHD